MEEVKKLYAKRQVTDALNTRNGPRINAIHDLPLNSPVLVWREGNTGQPGFWSGPHTLIALDRESCTVNMPRGPTSFRSTSVKPYYTEDNTEESPETQEQAPIQEDQGELPVQETPARPAEPRPEMPARPAEPRPELPVKRGRGRPRKYPLPEPTLTTFLQDNDEHPFAAARQLEVTGLLEKGVFQVVDRNSVPQETRIFNSRFVDEIKNKDTEKAFQKSRLVVQAYNDQEKDLVLTQSPTIQQISQRLVLCLAAINQEGNTHLYLRDISQAYVQSVTKLHRNFFILPPTELATQLGIARGSILRVVKPLYGVPEAGNHWFKTYHSHHSQELGMEQSTYDSCLLYRNDPFGVVGLQTDDTLFLGTPEFAALEQECLDKAQFLAKEREQLTFTQPLKFNGGLIQLDSMDMAITLTQERQCKSLRLVSSKPATTTSSRGTICNELSSKDQYVI